MMRQFNDFLKSNFGGFLTFGPTLKRARLQQSLKKKLHLLVARRLGRLNSRLIWKQQQSCRFSKPSLMVIVQLYAKYSSQYTCFYWCGVVEQELSKQPFRGNICDMSSSSSYSNIYRQNHQKCFFIDVGQGVAFKLLRPSITAFQGQKGHNFKFLTFCKTRQCTRECESKLPASFEREAINIVLYVFKTGTRLFVL